MKIKEHIFGFKCGFIWWFLNCFVCYFPSKHIRHLFLRMFGVKMSQNVHFYEGVHIRYPKGVTIEDGVSIGPRVLLDGRKGLHIGKSAVLGYECIIWSLNHDYNDINFCGKGGSVRIGAFSWICSRSIILPGITIGEGAVVASGAIVTHDVPPYTIVAGIPAKIVGRREEKKYTYGYNHILDNSHII